MPEQLLFFMQEIASADQAELILGTWCMAAHDIDRQLSSYARQSWDKFVSVACTPSNEISLASEGALSGPVKARLVLDTASFSGIWGFVQRVILDPGAVYLNVNPAQPTAPPPQPQRKAGGRAIPQIKKDEETSTRSRAEDEEENELDRNARLRIGALGAAEWVLSRSLLVSPPRPIIIMLCVICARPDTLIAISQEPKYIEDHIASLDNAALWTVLHHAQTAPFVPSEIQSFGWDQPGVRKSAWNLLQTLLAICKGTVEGKFCISSDI